MSRLSKIKAGVNNYTPVPIPGTNESAHLIVLSSEEMVKAKSEALEYCRQKEIGDTDSFNVILNSYVLYKALRVPEDHKESFADSAEEIRKLLSLTEIGYLMEKHMELQEDVSPDIEKLTDEEIERLKNFLETIRLNDLSGESIRILRNFLSTLSQ